MEYVYGAKGDVETLRTKGSTHSDLTGFQTVMIEYTDQKITDTFRVIRKYDSREDAEGNCYDWYEIDRHYRVQDRIPMVEALKSENEALRERNTALEEELTNTQLALCDVYEMIGG